MSPWYFSLYVVFFAVLLSFPVSHLIYTFSVRRLQTRMQRELSGDEISGQKRRALVLSGFICIIFSLFFSLYLVGMPNYG